MQQQVRDRQLQQAGDGATDISIVGQRRGDEAGGEIWPCGAHTDQ
jgi:hypothetical protein